ncbi:MAG: tRNA pseudouridine(13) synthase TruD [Candidatus Nanoarchaeia archaeon]|nr:tRNA pseudouridine(13) synthase TruD [Candidatus Nanoarchaeia archaeon]MDD5499301.1 tRNA pseudouridine(13) synthase TruD [Candidatus Nanoarchaeia archaeon]
MYKNFKINFEEFGIKTKQFNNPTKGFIKEKFEDFKVKELSIKPKEEKEGTYAYFTLKKTNWTTMDAIGRIAKLCHASWKRFSFAGTKDRSAVTEQLASAKGISIEALKAVKIKGIELSDFFKSNEPLRLGSLKGNEFEITVRNYECKNIKKSLEEFKEFLKKGVLNYFGEQRFGIQRPNNHVIGKLILRQEYEEALKELLAKTYEFEGEQSSKARQYLNDNWKDWKGALENFPKYLTIERMILNHLEKHPNDYVNSIRKLPRNIAKILVYSYQSYLFNLALSELYEKGLINDFELALVGHESDLKKMGCAIYEKMLEKEGITLSDFKVSSYPEMSSKGGMRKAIIYPQNFKILEIKKDYYTISFEMEKSAYATIILRELIG